MSFLEKWTKRATKTAHETFKEVSAKDAAEKLNILEPIVEIAMMVGVTIAAFKGAKSVSPTQIPCQDPISPMTVVPINLIFRRGDMP